MRHLGLAKVVKTERCGFENNTLGVFVDCSIRAAHRAGKRDWNVVACDYNIVGIERHSTAVEQFEFFAGFCGAHDNSWRIRATNFDEFIVVESMKWLAKTKHY